MTHDKGFLTEQGRLLIAQLWISGVAGAGLVFILQSFGSDWGNWRFGCCDWPFMIDRALRYALSFWFAAHLTIAYVLNEMLKEGKVSSLAYDIFQSIAGFVALGSLGFVTQNFTLNEPMEFAIPFWSIAWIAGLAWWNRRDSGDRKSQRIRASACGIGLVFGGVTSFWGPQSVGTEWDWRWMIVLAGTLLSWVALYCYWHVRLSHTPPNAPCVTTTDVSSMLNRAMEETLSRAQRLIDSTVEQKVHEALKMTANAPGLEPVSDPPQSAESPSQTSD